VTPAVGGVTIVFVGAADLLDAGVRVIHTAPSWIFTRPSRVVRHVTRDRVGHAPVRVLRPPDTQGSIRAITPEVYWDALIPNAGTWHGVAHVASYETDRVSEWGPLTAALRRDPLRLWRLTGARFTLQPTRALRGVPPAWVVGTMRQHGLSLLRVEDPAPRVYLARRSVAAGWTATVQGAPARLHRANAIHRAVWVPAGTLEVVMRYAPRGFRAGAWISAAAWTVCLGLLLAIRVRKRSG
jgi:hypothetical protein